MQIVIICIGYVCFVCVAAALTWTIVFYRERGQTLRDRNSAQNARIARPRFQEPRYESMRTSGRSHREYREREQTPAREVQRPVKQRTQGNYWRMELLDTTNGDRICKNFRGSVVLGRTQTQGETPDRCYVGTKLSISRRQCLIREYGPYLVVENLSQVNVTMHNNRYLEKPYYLNRGDHLSMGGSDYVVTRLDYIA